MKTMRLILAAVVAAAVGAALGTVAATGHEAPRRAGAPVGSDASAHAEPYDMGVGEEVYLVVGGTFETRKAAETANRAIAIGDVQGFYVASTDQFVGLSASLGASAGNYALVSAFRTQEGAKEFQALAQSAGAPAILVSPKENLGTEYVGLGQEAAPDGSGPLRGPTTTG
jgi:hypothetical protein